MGLRQSICAPIKRPGVSVVAGVAGAAQLACGLDAPKPALRALTQTPRSAAHVEELCGDPVRAALVAEELGERAVVEHAAMIVRADERPK